MPKHPEDEEPNYKFTNPFSLVVHDEWGFAPDTYEDGEYACEDEDKVTNKLYHPTMGHIPKPDVEQIAKNRFGFEKEKEEKILKEPS
jgi:hypothetical protein